MYRQGTRNWHFYSCDENRKAFVKPLSTTLMLTKHTAEGLPGFKMPPLFKLLSITASGQ